MWELRLISKNREAYLLADGERLHESWEAFHSEGARLGSQLRSRMKCCLRGAVLRIRQPFV
jgi:hypothetical protein